MPRVPDLERDMRSLLLPGQRSLHWRNEDDDRRKLIVETICRHDVSAFVALVREVPVRKKEEARAKALTSILRLLEADGIEQLVIEGRSGGDCHDKRTVKRARSSVALARFGSKSEPMLWVADSVASIRAGGACFSGGPHGHWDRSLDIRTEHMRRLSY